MNLHDWRKREGLTLEQVAEKIGCSGATVSRLERHLQTPSLALANKLRLLTEGQVTPNDFQVAEPRGPQPATAG